jgi:hypothetical protein
MLQVHAATSPGAEVLATLEAEIAPLASLHDVLRWGFSSSPARLVVEVIVQDEYCHDVILNGPDALFLVFDTT